MLYCEKFKGVYVYLLSLYTFRKKDDPKSVKSSKEIQDKDDSAATLEEEDNRSDSCDTSGLKFTEPRSSQKATSNVGEKARSVQQNTLFDSGMLGIL